MQNLNIPIQASEGLHARPAHLFCARAQKFQSEIKVKNVSTSSAFVNAKSILLVLTLGVIQGHEIEITASGADETEAMRELKELIESNFPE